MSARKISRAENAKHTNFKSSVRLPRDKFQLLKRVRQAEALRESHLSVIRAERELDDARLQHALALDELLKVDS
jgi:hypothetical protein